MHTIFFKHWKLSKSGTNSKKAKKSEKTNMNTIESLS